MKVSGIHLYPCNKPYIKALQRLLTMPSTSDRPPQLVVHVQIILMEATANLHNGILLP